MSADFATNRDAFNDFLDHVAIGSSSPTQEDALAAFRAYHGDLDNFKAKLSPSIEQADRAETTPLELNAILARVRERIAD